MILCKCCLCCVHARFKGKLCLFHLLRCVLYVCGGVLSTENKGFAIFYSPMYHSKQNDFHKAQKVNVLINLPASPDIHALFIQSNLQCIHMLLYAFVLLGVQTHNLCAINAIDLGTL